MQKPLTRFTQCGSLTMLFASFVVLFSLSSTALTTFGINKPQNQPGAPTPARKDLNRSRYAFPPPYNASSRHRFRPK